jgi:hypothetical protein
MDVRTWTDNFGDIWYNVAKDEWTLYAPGETKPNGVPNVSHEKMRAFYPEFPY